MKCKPVACIWSESPPVQRVTAVAALHEPPTLYTGGSDGSIIWWNLISSSGQSEIKPIAVLCGHAASIADLEICFPHEGSGIGEPTDSSDVPYSSSSNNCGALISACVDGVLCVWSRVRGHCRRRRKIPPWAGSPFMIRMVPGNRRYVCILCCFVRQEKELLSSIEEREDFGDNESTNSGPLKCAIVIVDSYTLGIVQTVLHGNIPIGPLMFMAVVANDDMEKQSVMVIDSFGRVVYLPIVKDFESKGSTAPLVSKDSSNLDVIEWVDRSKEKEQLVAFAKCSCVLALVHRTYCLFRHADNGTVLGEIPFSNDLLSPEDKIYVVGGVFLENYMFNVDDAFLKAFVAWNSSGKAVIYRVCCSSSAFQFDPLYTIPATLCPSDMRAVFSFFPLNKHLLRIESVCSHVKKHVFWRPNVSTWLVPQQNDDFEKLRLECVMLGQGNLFDNWAMSSSSTTDGQNSCRLEKDTVKISENVPLQNSGPSPHDRYGTYSSSFSNKAHQEGQLVSSSMVISENYLAPYGIVYGLFNGDIEIIRFHIFTALNFHTGSSDLDEDSHGQKQYLSGHKGAVLCLASHQMVSRSGLCNSNHVLLSGSMDCTVRVWDLDSGDPIAVLHQHVAPVRQIILPPSQTEYPWSDCFLTVGDDACAALVSLQTLRVERLFPGHVHPPTKVVWDGLRGYVACLCPDHAEKTDMLDVLYVWDVKTGARERVLRGSAAHSMFDHFLKVLCDNVTTSSLMSGNTSASSLIFPFTEATKSVQPQSNPLGKANPSPAYNASKAHHKSSEAFNTTIGLPHTSGTSNAVKEGVKSGLPMSVISASGKHLITSVCPFPGVCSLCFDLTSLMSLCSKNELFQNGDHTGENINLNNYELSTIKDGTYPGDNASLVERGPRMPGPGHVDESDPVSDKSVVAKLKHEWICSVEGCLLQFSLSFLHLWDVDIQLDDLLVDEMKLKRPDSLLVSTGMLGDRGSMTLAFPGFGSKLEIWRSSAEYSALRSLTIVSLAQHLISLSHSCSSSSSALAAFYTRKFAEKYPDLKPPLLQLLVSFWQNEFEHVKMAARSLFHCTASRAIPLSLCSLKSSQLVHHQTYLDGRPEKGHNDEAAFCSISDKTERVGCQLDVPEKDSEIISWLESYETQDWISCVGGTTQDAMAAQIIVAAALVVWYPTLVKPSLAIVVVNQLVKLVMAMNEKYSVAAAEILAEGMESTWKSRISSQIPHLIGDIFFQVECVSSSSVNGSAETSPPSLNIRETLVGILLPSLAMADILGFLHVIDRQIWSTASDSPVHVVALMTLIRVVRGSPRNLAPYLDKVVSFILQTMDPGNSAMRKSCLQSSMSALREVVRVFPMVALNDTSTRLAVGDAIGDIRNAIIRVYDMQSMSKIKVLDASGPPGLPSLLGEKSDMSISTAISALSFSLDGEGLVAFSENGLMIRWWSLGSAWWEKLSRTLVPVQCTKLILVPPWDGFSPNSARSSIMASVSNDDGQASSPGSNKSLSEVDRLKLLIHNLDISYRLEWVGERKIKLTQHSRELGTFQL